MLFNSLPYLMFLPVAAAVYFALPLPGRRVWLLAANYVFYGLFSPLLCLPLLYVTLLNYGASRIIDAPNASQTQRRTALIMALIGNFGLLFAFKYLTLFTGIELSPLAEFALPLGLSFYVFQTSSYTIDVYRRVIRAEASLLDVALYASYFPSLISGPIMRAGDLMPQFREHHAINTTRILSGFMLICWGLSKKLFIAEPLDIVVDDVYGSYDQQSGAALLIATYGFAVQIFCDFSAYTDIAIGSARIMGFRLMENFNAPYLALSVQDFWRRWHISLSTWLRDYLYIPLGGNRFGQARMMANLMVTMLLGGLWHGASWNFVIWGGLHGAYLVIERALGLSAKSPAMMGIFEKILRWLVTFHLICLGWIFFRCETLDQALGILRAIVFWEDGNSANPTPLYVLGAVLGLQILQSKTDIHHFFLQRPFITRWLCYGALALCIVAIAGGQPAEFIYGQF
jgi:D-alanyl-lipoteichoic acid acyltransferase DltB (MBOAT superfamily)